MPDLESHQGWKWEEVSDLDPWKKPDPFVFQLVHEMKRNNKNTLIRAYDLGCGIGRHTVLFARAGFETHASDISPEAIKKTQLWLKSCNLSATLKIGHFLSIEFPLDYFNLVVSIQTINHGMKDDVYSIIKMIHKWLKPGGSFLGTLKIKDPNIPFTSSNIKKINAQTISFIEGEERGIPHYFATLEEIPSIFKMYDLENSELMLLRNYIHPFTADNLKNQIPGENIRFLMRKKE